MRLDINVFKDEQRRRLKDVAFPAYDCAKMRQATREKPTWLHFGAGNIFRGYIANIAQTLLDNDLTDRGIIAAETFDEQVITDVYDKCDNLAILARMTAKGTIEKEIIASVAEAVYAFENGAISPRLYAIAASDTLQIISFTITEKGYALRDIGGNLLKYIEADMNARPCDAKSAMGVAAALLTHRFENGGTPVTMLSADNCSHNGEKLRNAILEIVNAWVNKGYVDAAAVGWIESSVGFPWSMIDKITPRPDERVKTALNEAGFHGMDITVTKKGTWIAPFVNAEAAEYLVVEDVFPNGRPPLEKAGVYVTDRETVNRTERMKVCTCLNPLHTTLAVLGCLLGYKSISSEMNDADLVALVKRIGYVEGMPVVDDPKILSPKDFIDEVVGERLPNPFMPDTPQRIASDTSQKIPIRFGETIKKYVERGDLDVTSLTAIPFVIAAWFRYLLGVDDSGNPMEISPDPAASVVRDALKDVVWNDMKTYNAQLDGILSNKNLFAVDLKQTGLSASIERMFVDMLGGAGSVRKALYSLGR